MVKKMCKLVMKQDLIRACVCVCVCVCVCEREREKERETVRRWGPQDWCDVSAWLRLLRDSGKETETQTAFSTCNTERGDSQRLECTEKTASADKHVSTGKIKTERNTSDRTKEEKHNALLSQCHIGKIHTRMIRQIGTCHKHSHVTFSLSNVC